MSPKAEAAAHYGPTFVRNAIIPLGDLSIGVGSGWREQSDERITALENIFLLRGFGQSVACGVSVVDREDADGKKLIDDGVSTVAALKRCLAKYEVNQEMTQDGHEWDARLRNIFDAGLPLTVVKYTDDEYDREAWNVAKHDEETNTVRWSSIHQKIKIVFGMHQRLGDWTGVSAALLRLYGPGKKSTIGRWVRAAKCIDKDVLIRLAGMPELKGSYIWDNQAMVGGGSSLRSKLGSTMALRALDVLAAHADDISTNSFEENICKPMKLLEVWHGLMSKRYGSVASQSPALARLMNHLSSRNGLLSVKASITAQVYLHAPGGIMDCVLPVREFDMCQSGGLPPPSASQQKQR